MHTDAPMYVQLYICTNISIYIYIYIYILYLVRKELDERFVYCLVWAVVSQLGRPARRSLFWPGFIDLFESVSSPGQRLCTVLFWEFQTYLLLGWQQPVNVCLTSLSPRWHSCSTLAQFNYFVVRISLHVYRVKGRTKTLCIFALHNIYIYIYVYSVIYC